MTRSAESLKQTKTILLTTYKRDGTPIPTPVSIAFDGERAFFRSYDRAWKTKRLRNNPHVEVAPATLRGEPTGPTISGTATLLSRDDAEGAARALRRGQRVLQGVLVPLAHRLMRYRTMHYELHLDGDPGGPLPEASDQASAFSNQWSANGSSLKRGTSTHPVAR
jgi:uncharacterized protein